MPCTVNSAANGLPGTINSIKQAIMILGHKQLQRWIQILCYVQKDMCEALLIRRGYLGAPIGIN